MVCCVLGVTWDQIAKLDEAKRVLKEAVVLPLLMPEVFSAPRDLTLART